MSDVISLVPKTSLSTKASKAKMLEILEEVRERVLSDNIVALAVITSEVKPDATEIDATSLLGVAYEIGPRWASLVAGTVELQHRLMKL